MNRRHFLMGSAAALSAASSVFGSPNDTVRVACIGVGGHNKTLGGRGKDHINGYSRLENVEVAAICDPDQTHLDYGVQLAEKAHGKKPQAYTDVRKLLEDGSIDAISIATPNHWHALITIWGCQAGKDVYVEKPCTHNMFEVKQIVAAARKYNRMVQQGSQIRSSVAVQEGVQKMRDGLIGDVYLSRGLCFKWRDTIGRAPVQPVPPGVDYDLWTGPAPRHDFTMNRFHYNWHWFWDYGNGDLGNQGIHEVDVARWGLGVRYPVTVSAIGGHFMFDDDQETPNTLNCAFQYDLPGGKRKMLEFEVRHWITDREAEIGGVEMGGEKGDLNTYGDIFFGSKGYLAIGNEDMANPYLTWLGKEQTPGPSRGPEAGHHYANFIDCVRSRKKEDLNAPIEEGHISTTLMHLANASYRLGRTLNFDAETEQVIGDDEANRLLRDADRGYRAPFVMPEEV